MHGLRCVYVLLFFLTLSDATSKWKSLNHKIDHVIHEIPTRKILGATKHTREKILNPQNTHMKTFHTKEIPTRKTFGTAKYPWRYYGTMVLDPGHLWWRHPLNFAQSSKFDSICFFKKMTVYFIYRLFSANPSVIPYWV